MTFFRFLAPLLVTGLTLTTRAQPGAANPLFHHIPPDADRVIHINSQALNGKIDWAQVLDAFPVPPSKDGVHQLVDLKEVFLHSGIDLHKDILITTTNSASTDSFRNLIFIGHLADSGKFIAYLHSKIKALRPQRTPGYRTEGSMEFGVAFTDKLAVFIQYNPPPDEKAYVRSIPSVEWQQIVARRAAAILRGFDRSGFMTNAAFQANFNDDADAHLYWRHGYNLAVLYGLLMGLGIPPRVFDLASPVGGNQSATTFGSIRLETGKLTYISKQPLDRADTLSSRLASRPFNEKLAAVIPSGKQVLAMASLHLDMAGFLARANTQGKLDSLLVRSGLETADIRHALSGDILLISCEPDQTAIDNTGKAAPVLLILAAIDQRPAFDKLSSKLEALHWSTAVHEDIAVIGTDQQEVQAFFPPTANPADGHPADSRPGDSHSSDSHSSDSHSSDSHSSDSHSADSHPADSHSGDVHPADRLATGPIRSNPIGLALDFRQIMDVLSKPQAANNSPAGQQPPITSAVAHLDRLFIATGGVRDGYIEAVYQVTTKDPAENPILAILRLSKAGLAQH